MTTICDFAKGAFFHELALFLVMLLLPNNIYIQLICNDIWYLSVMDLHFCRSFEQWTRSLNCHAVIDYYSNISINTCKYSWKLAIFAQNKFQFLHFCKSGWVILNLMCSELCQLLTFEKHLTFCWFIYTHKSIHSLV